MTRSRRSSASVGILSAAFCAAAASLFSTGCTVHTDPQKAKIKYVDLAPASSLHDNMKGTIHERSIMVNTEPHNVSSYGLVGQLRGTGDCTATNIVRQYMIKEMV